MNDDLLTSLLAAVDQQLASPDTRYVRATLDRLVKLGHAEEAARRQIAIYLGEEADDMLREKRAFDINNYRAALDALPFEEE